MAAITDKLFGLTLMMLSTVLFCYYTVWVIILPLFDTEHILNSYFLPKEFALIIPIILGLVLLSMVGVFILVVLYKDSQKKKLKKIK